MSIELESVVTFKWNAPGYRSSFSSEQVNISRRMVQRHYPRPLRFICVTDDPRGLDPEIEAVPLWTEHAELKNITWRDGPSCYRRLKVFSRDFARIAGARFVCIDLDMVIVGDLRPLWDRPEPFVIWNPHNRRVKYCASMFLMDAGAHAKIWESFDPRRSLDLARAAGCRGSDQAVINYHVRRSPCWSPDDGVYSYRDQVMIPRRGSLPPDARVVIFCGKPDPWEAIAHERSPWIREHYC
jgi:hypothetical protein